MKNVGGKNAVKLNESLFILLGQLGVVMEEIFEMANLSKRQTGVNRYIFISTKMGKRGPRVKYYRTLGFDKPSASFSIEDDPKILISSLDLSKKEIRDVKEFVKLNKETLLFFWNYGDEMDDQQPSAKALGLEEFEYF